MNVSDRVVVFGATGFVGRAATAALESRGVEVVPVRAPRLPAMPGSAARDFLRDHPVLIAELAESVDGAAAVVNAAGDPGAASSDESSLTAANALVPGLLAAATRLAGDRRFVQVSSAAVQGATPTLDSTADVSPFSPYSRSKALGEELVREFGGGSAVIYRPPGVHGPDRGVTRLTARIARSRLATVARPGTAPTPLTLVANVGDAIAFLTTCPQQPPGIVAHPWEGLTTAGVLSLLGEQDPRELPAPLARAVVSTLKAAGKVVAPLAGNARRAEMLWFGQAQADSWLTTAGWQPPLGADAWRELGAALVGQTNDRRVSL